MSEESAPMVRHCPRCGVDGHTLADQHCSMCRTYPAVHKIGEEGFGALGFHNLTNYLCCWHFRLVVGDCSRWPTYGHMGGGGVNDPDEVQVPAPAPDDPEYLHHLLYRAWGVIANAGGWRGQSEASPGWLEAAELWRDEWHEVLGCYCASKRPASRLAGEDDDLPAVVVRGGVEGPAAGDQP